MQSIRASKFLAAAGLTAGLLVLSAGVAHSQSAPPFGFWTTAGGGGQLLITEGGECSLAVNGRITTSGSCSWDASHAGGILTIMSNQLYRPAPIYFNVIWVNATTITVEGDTFYRGR